MDVDGLVRAIWAALDDTEQIARALGGEGWNAHEPAHGMRRVTVNFSTETVVACTLAARGEHIARHDPATVLRQVAADRRVLARHQPRRLQATHYRPEVVECEHCVRMCHSRSGLACEDPTDAPWPCDEIRDLADRLGINLEESTNDR